METANINERKLIIKIILLIGIIAILNLFGMIAPTWLLMATLLSIVLFIYENFSKWRKTNYVIFIVFIIFCIGGLLRLNTSMDAFLTGVDPASCKELQPLGLFTGGCGPEPTFKQIGLHLNDTLALLALAGVIGIHLKKNKK